MKFLLSRAGILAVLVLGACSHEEPAPEADETIDEAYYAELASIGSGSSCFTATDEGGEIWFNTEGGEATITVDCGCDWNVESNSLDIFNISYPSASSLTITATQNTVENDLVGTITFYTENQHIKFATVSVTQGAYGAPVISAETTEWHAPAVGETSTEIAVDASDEWTAETSDTWLAVGKTDTGLTLAAEENESTAERSAKVTLTCTDGIRTAREYVSVTQDAKAYVTLSVENVTLALSGDSANIAVDANYSWDFSYDNTNGWYTVGRDGDNLTITSTKDNETEEVFEGVVTITAGDGAQNVVETQITVTEENTTNALILVYTTEYTDMEVTLPLSGKVDCFVSWGDGAAENVTVSGPTHVYASAGEHTVVVNGTVTAISHSGISDEYNIPALTAVKSWGNTGLTTMSYAFSYCQNLKSIPDDTMETFSGVSVFDNAFNYCTDLESIPSGLLTYATKATSFASTFKYCSSLTSIPEDLFSTTPNITSFSGTFGYCSGLTSIPDDLFSNCPAAQSFSNTFQACTSLTTIPENLFVNNTAATNFSSVFSGCSGLTSVPDRLFADHTKVTTFFNAFRDCTALKSVGAGVFSGCTALTTLNYLFCGCTALESVAADIFSGINAPNFGYLFFECSSLKSIPEGLFAECTAATNFSYAFYDCTSLESLGIGAFANCTAVTNFSDTFYGCTSLTTIPEELFSNCSAVTNFSDTFYGCTSLTTIPADLFSGCSAVTTFSGIFNGCSALTSIPENLFADCKAATTFTNAFNGCSALSGESAYDLVETDAGQVNVHLYERKDYTDAGYTAPTAYSDCYTACTGLNDYMSINKYWGGGYRDQDYSAVLGTYTATGYAYSDNGTAAETTWTLKIYESMVEGYDIVIDGLVPWTEGMYPDSEAYIAQATYSAADGKIVIPAQLTGYTLNYYYLGWYPCSSYANGTWSSDESVTDCTFTYDSATDTWTSDYGEYFAGFGLGAASYYYFSGFFDAVAPGIVLTRTSSETGVKVQSNRKPDSRQVDRDFVLHTDLQPAR